MKSFSLAVACPEGSFYDKELGECAKCDTGTYQDEEGQTSCKTCPTGYTTYSENSQGAGECYPIKGKFD